MTCKKILMMACTIFVCSNASNAQIVNTIAGNGTGAFGGDGGTALSASLNYPVAVALDQAGNLYVADHLNNRVRKITTAGTISTIAGNGTAAWTGDGGPATSASLNHPSGVAVDNQGNIFIADQENHVVRKVNTNGTISTIAGSGAAGPYTGDGGPATSCNLSSPAGVAVDAAGNVYVTDPGNHAVHKITTGGIISSFDIDHHSIYPVGHAITVSNAGGIYFSDLDSHGILYSSNTITAQKYAGYINVLGTGGDGGIVTNASFMEPTGLAFDNQGRLFIADHNAQTIRMVDANNIITTIAGTVGAQGFSGDGTANAYFNNPYGVAVDNAGNVYVADAGNNRIRKISSPLAVNDEKNTTGSIRVYPNPGAGVFNVSGNANNAEDVFVQVRDVTGRTILNERAAVSNGQFKQQINMPATSAKGLYLVNVIAGRESKVMLFENK